MIIKHVRFKNGRTSDDAILGVHFDNQGRSVDPVSSEWIEHWYALGDGSPIVIEESEVVPIAEHQELLKKYEALKGKK